MKITTLSVLFYLIFALVEVHSQTIPYVRFLDDKLQNHSYVDFNLVTAEGDRSVQCRTDLGTCCREIINGPHRGDWFFPSGEKLPFSEGDSDIYKSERSSNVQVRRRNNATTAGIYRCEIETSAAHNGSRGIVYAGLYSSGGSVNIPRGIQFREESDLTGKSPQFTLTCISTGGPATTVNWTRDSEEVLEGLTVLDDAETAQYNHTLTVTGRRPGNYRCFVSNNKPSTDVIDLNVRAASAPTNLMAVQEGPTGIRVSWTPPSPLGDTIGFRIFYSGGSSGSVDISDRNTDNHLLTDLLNGSSYTVSIVGTSQHLPSEHVEWPNIITMTSFPSMPNAMVSSTSATVISLSWNVPSGSVVERYEVVWKKNSTEHCLDQDIGNTTITDGSTSYSITGLEEGSSYTITVTATNRAGSVASDPVSGMTQETVPSAPPTNVSVSDVTSSSMTVLWGAVDCIHRNGDIIGYSVRYGEQGHVCITTMSVCEENIMEVIIHGLRSNVIYSVAVAAVNNGGIGEYSHPITVQTAGNPRLEDCDCAGKLGASVAGGFVGGALITAVLAIVIHLLLMRRMSKIREEQKGQILISINQAYGHVTRDEMDAEYTHVTGERVDAEYARVSGERVDAEYRRVTREEEDTEYESTGTISGIFMVT